MVFQIPASIHFDGKGGSKIEALFDTRKALIGMDEWLSQPLLSQHVTVLELIKSVADKESAHSDEHYNQTLKFTRSIKLVDEDVHKQTIVAIGEYIVQVMDELEKQIPNDLRKK